AETPADGGFVNRSFLRGMDVTILAQKTHSSSTHYPVPTRQDQDSRRLLEIQPPTPTLRDTGRRGSRLWPLRGSHLGTAPHPRPWGPREEDQPLVDTAMREMPDTGMTRTHASLLSRHCHHAIGGEQYRMMGKGTCTSNG
ncbi:hypothetical protein PVAP13_1NG107932, partial [Panicum virgatum]